MRRFLPLLVILLVGCGGAAGSAPPDGSSTASNAPSGAPSSDEPSESSTPASEAPSQAGSANPSGAAMLPAECAEGLAAYLVAIEPLVAEFDPATATLGDLFAAEEPVRSKSMELLDANDSRAPYSCSEVGLEWAYFDSNTPWAAVLAVAADAAPGTVAYLTGLQATSAIDVNPVSDYGVEGCDAAVERIKELVAAQTSADVSGVAAMAYEDGLALLGLYKAYLRDVRDEVCPRDVLGNDEFDFFLGVG